MLKPHQSWRTKLSDWTGVAIWILLTWGLQSDANAEGRGVDGDYDAWDATTQSLDLLDGAAFKSVVYPLVQIAGNAYRYPAVIPIPGWTLVDSVAPIHGGMHAVLYEEEEDQNSRPGSGSGSGSRNRRMILSFRGTDLSGDEASLADFCADEFLWNDTEIAEGIDCLQLFSVATIDYYSQAVDYTRRVLEAYPQASLLLSGHSLGAGLAILVSATIATATATNSKSPHHPQHLPVIAFGSAGTRKQLAERSLHVAGDHERKLFVVADKWDEIMRTEWDTQVGILCLYETAITEDCTKCFQEKMGSSSAMAMAMDMDMVGIDTSSPLLLWGAQHQESGGGLSATNGQIKGQTSLPCSKCFYQTHYLQHVIDLVDLGNKPDCKPRPPSI